MIKTIKQFFCIHKFEMTEEAKKSPSLDLKDGEQGIEIREHACTKCEKTTMLSSGIIA